MHACRSFVPIPSTLLLEGAPAAGVAFDVAHATVLAPKAAGAGAGTNTAGEADDSQHAGEKDIGAFCISASQSLPAFSLPCLLPPTTPPITSPPTEALGIRHWDKSLVGFKERLHQGPGLYSLRF